MIYAIALSIMNTSNPKAAVLPKTSRMVATLTAMMAEEGLTTLSSWWKLDNDGFVELFANDLRKLGNTANTISKRLMVAACLHIGGASNFPPPPDNLETDEGEHAAYMEAVRDHMATLTGSGDEEAITTLFNTTLRNAKGCPANSTLDWSAKGLTFPAPAGQTDQGLTAPAPTGDTDLTGQGATAPGLTGQGLTAPAPTGDTDLTDQEGPTAPGLTAPALTGQKGLTGPHGLTGPGLSGSRPVVDPEGLTAFLLQLGLSTDTTTWYASPCANDSLNAAHKITPAEWTGKAADFRTYASSLKMKLADYGAVDLIDAVMRNKSDAVIGVRRYCHAGNSNFDLASRAIFAHLNPILIATKMEFAATDHDDDGNGVGVLIHLWNHVGNDDAKDAAADVITTNRRNMRFGTGDLVTEFMCDFKTATAKIEKLTGIRETDRQIRTVLVEAITNPAYEAIKTKLILDAAYHRLAFKDMLAIEASVVADTARLDPQTLANAVSAAKKKAVADYKASVNRATTADAPSKPRRQQKVPDKWTGVEWATEVRTAWRAFTAELRSKDEKAAWKEAHINSDGTLKKSKSTAPSGAQVNAVQASDSSSSETEEDYYGKWVHVVKKGNK
ncbi:hypothetical protein TeGR_g14669 [Tetraparma gracilis]|uniref:Uncharacterized protein n=1 Tax=Tetraparma gracilis TaxID=2962635 RepID=A0ABQ6MKW6_9STRA|nr:hypothetical protein TeGR_g14669 [Tetraparma gracilis]